MPDYDDTNRGVAFTNDYKKEDKHPDWKGKGNFKGVDFEFGVWERTSPKGRYLSFKFSEPFEKKDAPQQENDEQISLKDIPF